MSSDRLKNGLIHLFSPAQGVTSGILLDYARSNNALAVNHVAQSWQLSRFGYPMWVSNGTGEYAGTGRTIYGGRAVVSTAMWCDVPSTALNFQISEYTASGNRWSVAIASDGNCYTVNQTNPPAQDNFGSSSYALEDFSKPFLFVSVLDVTQSTNTNRLRHFINGTERSITYSGSGPLRSDPINNHPSALIGWDGRPSSFTNGRYLTIAVWDRPLSANEQLAIYGMGPLGLADVEQLDMFFGAQLFNAAWAKNSNQLVSAGVI